MSRCTLWCEILVLLAVYAGCGGESGRRGEAIGPSAAKEDSIAHAKLPGQSVLPTPDKEGYVPGGSKSCRDCHEDFYRLWATSRHGLAMQPYTKEFARSFLKPQQSEITIGQRRYRAEIGDGGGFVRETGPGGAKKYPIVHVLGGKNVFYFLTPFPRGRLQVLPVGYDVHREAWFDTAASGVRHFPDRRDEALDWTDRLYTFNTACFNCHVSRLCTNYDLAADAYHTTWSEPGISCETCHGPAGGHLQAMETAADPKSVRDIQIIRAKQLTTAQWNALCASCHAKLVPLSLDFKPGDQFFDHFDLIVLDHPDYYPDGRDLGENYTYTSWMLGRCGSSGKLDCNHCHTPSGRLRYSGGESNRSCAPCHQEFVDHPAEHGHHAPGSAGNECVGCHMPGTRFAGMGRTDHSMLPPAPAATLALQSPNACNLCHADQDAAWSDGWVRTWYPRDYQAPVLDRAALLQAARNGEWKRLPEMLEKIAAPQENAVYKASLARLLRGCRDESKWPALVKALGDASPLVRSSAASSLADRLDHATVPALLAATRDPSRLVRLRAAAALASFPAEQLEDGKDRRSLQRATEEFISAMQARPDDWAGQANLGTFYMEQRDYAKAVVCFETAIRLEPHAVGPMVNASMAFSNMRQNGKAESMLRRALQVDPQSPAALFNLGLLLAEENRPAEAEESLRAALKADPEMAAAAYNLGILCGNARIDEAVRWCRRAYELQPDQGKYTYTLAFFLRKKGEPDRAAEILRGFIGRNKLELDAYLLLGEIYEDKGDKKAAVDIYRQALAVPGLPSAIRNRLESKVRSLAALPAEQGR